MPGNKWQGWDLKPGLIPNCSSVHEGAGGSTREHKGAQGNTPVTQVECLMETWNKGSEQWAAFPHRPV